MNVILIFTYGISLKKWSESGLIDRELELYKELEKINGVTLLLLLLVMKKMKSLKIKLII